MSLKLTGLSFSYVALQFFAVLLLFLYPFNEGFSSALLLIISSLAVMRIALKNMILAHKTYMPMFMFLLVSVGVVMPSWQTALAAFCLAQSTLYVTFAFRREYSFDYVFRAGMMLSVGAIFAFECVFLLPAMIVGMWYSRRTLREVIVAIGGFCLPLLAVAYVNLTVFGEDFSQIFVQGFHSIGWASCPCKHIYSNGYLGLINLCFIFLTFLISISFTALQWKSLRRKALRLSMFLIWQAASCLVIFAFSSSSSIYALMAVPMAVLMPRAFIRMSTRWGVVLYCLLLGAIVGGRIFLIIYK